MIHQKILYISLFMDEKPSKCSSQIFVDGHILYCVGQATSTVVTAKFALLMSLDSFPIIIQYTEDCVCVCVIGQRYIAVMD